MTEVNDIVKTAMANVDREMQAKPFTPEPVKSASDFRPAHARVAEQMSGVEHARKLKETDDKSFEVLKKTIDEMVARRTVMHGDVKKMMKSIAEINHEIMVAENMLMSRDFAASMLEVSSTYSLS